MAIWSMRTRTVTRREWILPFHDGSASSARVIETITAARAALADEQGCKVSELPDNAVGVTTEGDVIVVYFEIKHTEFHG